MPKTTKNKTTTEEPLEKQLWKTADKLRKNIDAAEYKHIVLGLIFLKYISDSFEEVHEKLLSGKGDYAGADPEDRDEYRAENVFFVPPQARWKYLQSRAKLPKIGKDADSAMDALERDNPSLKGVLPKVFARQNLDPASLGGLIDLVGNIALGNAKARSADVLELERLEPLLSFTEVVNQAFYTFTIRHSQVSMQQLRFLDLLKDYILEKGYVEQADLVEMPFTQLHGSGILGLFNQRQVKEIVHFTEKLTA
jgi:hypothetical protein